MSKICAGHKVSAANDVWCLDFARTPAESLKVYSQNSLIITVDRARFMYWQTCQTFNPQSQSNVMRIHRWLMPEHTFIANELRGTCVGLRGPRSFWGDGGLEAWAPDWCAVFGRSTPVIPSRTSATLHSPSPVTGHCFPESPEGGKGRAAWWTSGTGEHPRQRYLIRLPQPSTGRGTIRERERGKKA